MWFLFIVISWFFSQIALGQIIYPIFHGLPQAKKEKEAGNLKHKIPRYLFVVPSLIWILLLIGSVLMVIRFQNFYLSTYVVILIINFIYISKSLSDDSMKPYLLNDFKKSIKKYLK